MEILLSFIFLASSILSLWVKREPKIWGTLLVLSVIMGQFAGLIDWTGIVILGWILIFWIIYLQNPNLFVFILLVAIGIAYKFKLLPGFPPYSVTPTFVLGLINPIIGLLPLALVVPLSDDWKSILKGTLIGCIGIGLIALLAILSSAIRLNVQMPEYLYLFSNLFLTCIPEEGFYRGFIQNVLCSYLGKTLGLILTAGIFALTHIFWSPNLGVLALTFIAGLLYGGVYLYSRKIESAILCHFLLNVVQMTLFKFVS